MKRTDIEEVTKIDNNTIRVLYVDGQKEVFTVHQINTRKDAITKCIESTKKALKREDAFEKLDTFRNDFSRLRNYELEDYLDIHSDKYYRICDRCPFNDFMWYE